MRRSGDDARAGTVRRGVAAGAVVLLALALAGLGASPAQAVADTFKVVFQANDHVLAGYSSSGSNFSTTLGMLAGTSPSVALLTDGSYEAAFEANNHNLAVSHLGGGSATTTLGMEAGTSPAIAALPGGGWVAAFQDNDNVLYLYDSHGDKINTDLGMDPGTSPAVAVQPGGSYRVVFQANNNRLAGYNSSGSNYTTTVGMKPGTSPSITAQTGGSYEIAAQANTGDLATIHLGTGYTVNTTTLGMDPAASPAIAAQPGGSFAVVFQANNNLLAGYNSSGSNYTTTVGMKPGTSPSITPEPDGTYEIAAQANTSDLATIHLGTGYTVNTTTLGMDPTTSPTLANPPPAAGSVGAQIVSFAESQIGYHDSPSGTFCNAFSAYWGSGSDCGNGNFAEEWCADFDAWAWRQAGVSFTYGYSADDINGAAASFYQWGVANGTWHAAGSGYVPQPGDVVIYGLNSKGTSADHAAIVTSYTPGDAGPNVVNGDWWVGGNGGVVAATDQTTATGTDGISGYVSPARTGRPSAQAPPAAAQATAGTSPAVRRKVSAVLTSGLYTDGPDGTPHYTLSFTSGPGNVLRGSVSFLYQDGRIATAGSYAGALSGGGKLTLALGDGKALSGRYMAGRLNLAGCAAVLPLATFAGDCSFTYHGHVP